MSEGTPRAAPPPRAPEDGGHQGAEQVYSKDYWDLVFEQLA